MIMRNNKITEGKMKKLLLLLIGVLVYTIAVNAYQMVLLTPQNISFGLVQKPKQISNILEVEGTVKSEFGNIKNVEVRLNCSSNLVFKSSQVIKIVDLAQGEEKKFKVLLAKSGKKPDELGRCWLKMLVEYSPDYTKILKWEVSQKPHFLEDSVRDNLIGGKYKSIEGYSEYLFCE